MTPVTPPFTPAVRAGGQSRSLISLTPLIDVVFILLIFFMLASSFLDWRTIELDASRKAGPGSVLEGSMLVEIRPDGIRSAGRAITPEALEESLRQRLADDPDLRVLVKPTAGVELQQAVSVLDRISAAGTGNVTLIRDPQGGR